MFIGGIIELRTIFSQLVSGSDTAIADSTRLSFALFRPLLTRVQAIVASTSKLFAQASRGRNER